jgi:nicotinamidase-related amidase
MSPINPQRCALIIIDVQQSFTRMPFWSPQDLPAFQQAVLQLQDGCRARGVALVHIFHVGENAPFSASCGWVKPMAWLSGTPDVRFDKHTHNAFTDTGLDLWLRRRGIDKLIICGMRTEQCCETTARVGSDLGYAVDFVTEATLTFAMTHARTGVVYCAEDIKTRSELVLDGRFARIVDVAGALSSLEPA